MYLPSNLIPGQAPQLHDWRIEGREAPAASTLGSSLRSAENRLPEGHTVYTAARHDQPSTAALVSAPDCGSVDGNDYTWNVLSALVTPRGGCPAKRYARNAELRESVSTALKLHSRSGDQLLEARLKSLGLPSLLRDESRYLPGTLAALRYDIGAHTLSAERPGPFDVHDMLESALQEAGESELSRMGGSTPGADQVGRVHARILDFHYRAAGIVDGADGAATPEAAPAAGMVRIKRVAKFVDHLERCQPKAPTPRPRRKAAGRIPLGPFAPHHDHIEVCSIL